MELDPAVRSSLDAALRRGDAKTFRRLLAEHPEFLRPENGADRLARDAALQGRLPLLEILVELGADVDAEGVCDALIDDSPEPRRWFPLELAAAAGRLDVVEFLVRSGAVRALSAGGRNAATLAEEGGCFDVRDYLRSLGMRTLRESTPPDPAAGRLRCLEAWTERLGPLGTLQREIAGDSAVTLHHVPANAKSPYQTLFTLGLADRPIPDGRDMLACLEVRCTLPADWPLDAAALADPRTNWPVLEMERIADELRRVERRPDAKPMLFMHGDPPRPFAPDTALCGWMGLPSHEWSVERADRRRVDLVTLHPIHADEARRIETTGFDPFFEAMVHLGFPRCIDPSRPSCAPQE